MGLIRQLFCKHDDLIKIRITMAHDSWGRLTLHRTKYKCRKCGKIIIKGRYNNMATINKRKYDAKYDKEHYVIKKIRIRKEVWDQIENRIPNFNKLVNDLLKKLFNL